MSTPSSQPRQASCGRRASGFTLIEILIAIAVMGVLAAVAFPSYVSFSQKSRRADAFNALAALQQAQERWRSNHDQYGNFNATPDANTLPSNVARSSSDGHYVLTVSGTDGTGYTAVATAQGPQAHDTACKLMGVKMNGGNLKYGSGDTSIAWTADNPDAGNCWRK
jgi:type IV pilus assembly protein PilE